jgi:hypothetical protein
MVMLFKDLLLTCKGEYGMSGGINWAGQKASCPLGSRLFVCPKIGGNLHRVETTMLFTVINQGPTTNFAKSVDFLRLLLPLMLEVW